MILVQTIMGIMIIAIIYTFSKQLWSDIKSDWLFDVNKLSFNPNNKKES